MNHHLRFVGPAALAAGVILKLSSCSSTKIEPLVANPKHEITYEVQIFDRPFDKALSKELAIVDADAAAEVMRSFDEAPSFRGTIGGRLGQQKTLSNKKKFTYPSAYDPPVLGKKGENGIFPVTPAKPRDFVTTQVGTTISLTGSKLGGSSVIRVQLDRKIFLGFVNYGTPITGGATDFFGREVVVVLTENRIEQPRFSAYKYDSEITLKEGQNLIITYPGIQAPDEGKFPFSEKRPSGFIAVIRIAQR